MNFLNFILDDVKKYSEIVSKVINIDVEIMYKIGRKTLVLPCKQAVFVAQYYPIRAQWLAFQWFKVARKKSENLQKLLLWCRKVPVISEPRLGRLIIQSLI